MIMYTMKDEAKYNVRSLRKSFRFHAFHAFRCRCCYRSQPERDLKRRGRKVFVELLFSWS